MADRVSGHGFRYECRVGFGESERAEAQTIQVDFEARTDWRKSAQSDHAYSIVDYAEVDRLLAQLVTGRSWRLIESIAEAVAEKICIGFPVDQVCVTVTKQPADMPHCDAVSVSCSRTPADYITA